MDPLVVAAASDLRAASEDLRDFMATTAVGGVQFVFGSSGLLREQVVNGAPFDVYMSANVAYVEQVIGAGRALSSEPMIYAVGPLAVISGNDRPLVSVAQSVLSAERIVIAQPRHAPYGAAAREVLENLGLWDRVESRLVYADNVADAVRIVESGEVDVGIVAQSLVTNTPHLEVDPSLHEPLRQAAVALRGIHESRALAFLEALRSEAVQQILRRYGFKTDAVSSAGG